MTPGYWMHETSGALRPAAEAYLHHQPLTGEHIAALRAYLRQWIFAPVWCEDAEIGALRARIEGLTSREAIAAWLDAAGDIGIDPL